MQPIIDVSHVSMRFRMDANKTTSLKEWMLHFLKREQKVEEFWALKDVSFQVQKGEVIGIIGRNGSGKSTILKVISGIFKPTSGKAVAAGRVVPMLELGSGFDMELSGRENVFLNGALLGYSREDMEKVFDEIVEFSELGQFINSPIRTYSSGMYARLGFAVATAHVPDILILDEILSVGDEAFQKKSRERLLSFQERGATVLMVSHALDSMIGMCNRIAWLDQGNLRLIGEPDDVISAYREENI